MSAVEQVNAMVAAGQLRICRGSNPISESEAQLILDFHHQLHTTPPPKETPMEPIPAPDQAKAGRPDCKLVAMGPPRGVSDEDCGTAEMLISEISNEMPGYPARRQYAYYRPNEAELAHLAAGGFIEFCQYGQVVQPFSATIWAPADVQNELRRQILEGDVPTQDCADPETHDPHVIVTEGDDGEEQKRFCTGNGQAALP